jgi:molybdopterin-guanine dinucleotide biosynthesis protein A
MPQFSPPLHGLVLAGGRGTRLGQAKGELDYHGQPQARWAHALLVQACGSAFVAVRLEQAATPPYADLPLIVDARPDAGPGAGLLAAFGARPQAAWLVLAADLPLVDLALLADLCAARDPAVLATAYRGADGGPEPLCAIFEPAARTALQSQPPERLSLRRLLATGPSRLLGLAEPARLQSVNTPADDAAARAWLARRASHGVS